MANLKKAYCSWCNNLILLKPHNHKVMEDGRSMEWTCFYSYWADYAEKLTKEYYEKESAKKETKRKT